MDERRRLSVTVGAFVLLALVLGALAIFTLGSQGRLLRSHYQLVTYFDNVQGLAAGAPVRLAGKSVGTVESVSFAPLHANVPPIRVVLQIDSSVQGFIRNDSVASIGTIGLLGDKYVELSMGSSEAKVLQGGEEIASVSPPNLSVALERATRAVDNISALAENMNKVVVQFGNAMGGKKMAQATSGITSIVNEIENGNGLLHSFIYNKYEGETLEDFEHTLATVSGIFDEVANGQGLVHQLIYGKPADQAALNRALQAVARLDDVLTKIDDGQGTLGLLVNDPTLYNDLKLLVGGARRSLVVRSLVRLSVDSEDHR